MQPSTKKGCAATHHADSNVSHLLQTMTGPEGATSASILDWCTTGAVAPTLLVRRSCVDGLRLCRVAMSTSGETMHQTCEHAFGVEQVNVEHYEGEGAALF